MILEVELFWIPLVSGAVKHYFYIHVVIVTSL